MSHKLLTVVCALALVLGLSLSATAAVQNVKVGGDIEIKGIDQNAYDILNKIENAAGVEVYNNDPTVHDYLMTTTRLYIEASLTDNVSAMVRVLNTRDWDMNYAPTNTVADDINIDLAYLTLSEMYGYPVTLTIGRQELLYGEGFLVGDGVRTIDASQTYQYDTRKAFDAIKAEWDYAPHKIDLFVAKVTEGSNVSPFATFVLPPVYVAGVPPRDTDNDLYGFDWNYDGGVYGMWDLGLFYNKSDALTGFLGLPADKATETWALSVRGEGNMPSVSVGTLALKGELVKEWGMVESNTTLGTSGFFGASTDAQALDAWGGYLEGQYTFDNPYAPYIGLGYIYMSGDDYDNDKIQQFNPLFEDEKYGEIAEVLYGRGFLNAPGTRLMGLGGDTMITNASIWKASFGVNPTQNTKIDLTYYNLTAAQPVYSLTTDVDDQKKDIGSEYDLTFTYNYSEDVSFGLLYALFVPGDYFKIGADDLAGASSTDVSLESAQELMGSVKVAF